MNSEIEKFQKMAEESDSDLVIQRYVLRNLVSAEILESMERVGISKSQLAEKMKCTKGHISRILSGDRNMTLDTISDIATVLGIQFTFSGMLKDEISSCQEYEPVEWKFDYNAIEEGRGHIIITPTSAWTEHRNFKVA